MSTVLPQAEGYFDPNGTALTKEQRLIRAQRKGLCPRCGIKTHNISAMTRRRVPINDGDVHQGHCIKCDPDNVPLDAVLQWEEQNPDKLAWAKRTDVHKHRGIQNRQLQQQKEGHQRLRHSGHSTREQQHHQHQQSSRSRENFEMQKQKLHNVQQQNLHNSWPQSQQSRLRRRGTTGSAPQFNNNNKNTQPNDHDGESPHKRASSLKELLSSGHTSNHSDQSECYCSTCGTKIYEMVEVTSPPNGSPPSSPQSNRLSLNNILKKRSSHSKQQKASAEVVLTTKLEPLTIAGAVQQGRCLLCHPTPNHEDGAILRPPSPPPTQQQQQNSLQHSQSHHTPRSPPLSPNETRRPSLPSSFTKQKPQTHPRSKHHSERRVQK